MTFLEFRDKMLDLGCFSTHQVYAWQRDFDRNNFTRWINKGLLIRLRQGYYTFPVFKSKPDYALFFAGRIYQPSYISLHTALSFYGMIPEAVVQITSITTLKTNSFKNDFGEYSYHSISEDLMFGYDPKSFADNRTIHIAKPEKALLDLLYLYPFYNSIQELENLRLDEDFMQNDFNYKLFQEYTQRFQNKALEKRVQLLLNSCNL